METSAVSSKQSFAFNTHIPTVDAYFDTVSAGIAEQLKEEKVRKMHDKDPRLLVGVFQFLNLVTEGELDHTFIPFMAFVDAVQKKRSQTGLTPGHAPTPHRDCSIYFGEYWVPRQ